MTIRRKIIWEAGTPGTWRVIARAPGSADIILAICGSPREAAETADSLRA